MSSSVVAIPPGISEEGEPAPDPQRFVTEREYRESYYEAEGGYEWISRFAVWVALGVMLVAAAFTYARGVARSHLVRGGGVVFLVLSLPFLYELARLLNKVAW